MPYLLAKTSIQKGSVYYTGASQNTHPCYQANWRQWAVNWLTYKSGPAYRSPNVTIDWARPVDQEGSTTVGTDIIQLYSFLEMFDHEDNWNYENRLTRAEPPFEVQDSIDKLVAFVLGQQIDRDPGTSRYLEELWVNGGNADGLGRRGTRWSAIPSARASCSASSTACLTCRPSRAGAT